MKINGYEPMQQLPTQRPAQPSAQTNPTASQQQLQDDTVTLSSGKIDGMVESLMTGGGKQPPLVSEFSGENEPLGSSGGGHLPPPPL